MQFRASFEHVPEEVECVLLVQTPRGRRACLTATGRSGHFKGRPGMGPTLREWDTDGTDLPADVKDRALEADHTMIQWD